jgi:hypothetical protein
MNPDSEAAVIINDLDSLVHRIEGLQAHPRYTDALVAVQAAKQAVLDGRGDIHQTAMRERFAEMDKANGAVG